MIVLAIVIDSELAAKISALAVIVGTLGTTVQALLQKPWWSPKVKWALSWVWAVVGGLASYVAINGIPNEFSITNVQAIFAFVVGAYGAIRLGYEALKRPIVDKIEEEVGLGANQTPTGKPEEGVLEDVDVRSEVPDPYGDRGL